MKTEFEYYYNKVPTKGLCRNNLIYTSLISKDKKTFCQWYYNDTAYHHGHNQIIDPSLMEEKWLREVNYITQMRNSCPDLVPNITHIDFTNHKLYFEIDGPDMWELVGCTGTASISLRSVMSHISEERQADLFPKMAAAGIDVDAPTPHREIQLLAFESFKTNFPDAVMEQAKEIYA